MKDGLQNNFRFESAMTPDYTLRDGINKTAEYENNRDMEVIVGIIMGTLITIIFIAMVVFLSMLNRTRRYAIQINNQETDRDMVMVNPHVDESQVMAVDYNPIPRPLSIIEEDFISIGSNIATAGSINTELVETVEENKENEPQYYETGYFYNSQPVNHYERRLKIVKIIQWAGFVCFQFQSSSVDIVVEPAIDYTISVELEQLLSTLDVMHYNILWTPSAHQIEYTCERIISLIGSCPIDRFFLVNNINLRIKLTNLIFSKMIEIFSTILPYNNMDQYQNYIEGQFNGIVKFSRIIHNYCAVLEFPISSPPGLVTFNETHV